jgi:hypothetical protein
MTGNEEIEGHIETIQSYFLIIKRNVPTSNVVREFFGGAVSFTEKGHVIGAAFEVKFAADTRGSRTEAREISVERRRLAGGSRGAADTPAIAAALRQPECVGAFDRPDELREVIPPVLTRARVASPSRRIGALLRNPERRVSDACIPSAEFFQTKKSQRAGRRQG